MAEETERVDDPDPPAERTTPLGTREAVNPEGETAVDMFTVPEKLFWLERLIVDVPVEPD